MELDPSLAFNRGLQAWLPLVPSLSVPGVPIWLDALGKVFCTGGIVQWVVEVSLVWYPPAGSCRNREISAGGWQKYQKDKPWPVWAWSCVSPTHKYSVSREDGFLTVLVNLCLVWFQKASKNKTAHIECCPRAVCVLFLRFWTIF